MGATGPIDPPRYDRLRRPVPRSSAAGLQVLVERDPGAVTRLLADVGLTLGRRDLVLREPTFVDGDGQVLDLFDAWTRIDRDPLTRRRLVGMLRVMREDDAH